jgi:hypothetical protein
VGGLEGSGVWETGATSRRLGVSPLRGSHNVPGADGVLQSPEIRRVRDPDYATRGIPSGTGPVTVP